LAVTDAGLATSVDLALLGAPSVNVTGAVLVMGSMVAVTVLVSAVLELRRRGKSRRRGVPEAGDNVLFVPVLLSDTACLARVGRP